MSGSANAIALTQRSRTHYFQRPDREVTTDGLFDTGYDTTATSLRGYGFYSRLAKENGNWLWEAQTNWRSPGFEIERPLVPRPHRLQVDEREHRAALDEAGHAGIAASVMITGGQQQFNYDGLRTDAQQQVYFGLEFLNYWNLRSFVHPQEHARTTTGSRAAGPTVKSPGWNFGHFQVSTDPRQRAVFDVTLRGIARHRRDGELRASPPASRSSRRRTSSCELAPSYNWSQSKQQYIQTRRRSDGDGVRRQPLPVRLRDDARSCRSRRA